MLYNLTTQPTRIIIDGDGPTLVVNRDLSNQVLYGPQSIANVNINEYSVLDPLGSINLDGCSGDIYAIAAAGAPTVDVVNGGSGWTPSPVQTAAQIALLGLATATNQTTYGNTQATAANQGTQITGQNAANGYLAGTSPGALIGNVGRTLGQEVAGLIGTGSATGVAGGVPINRYTNNLGKGAAISPAPGGAPTTLLSAVPLNQPGMEAEFTAHFAAGTGTSPFIELIFQWIDQASGYVTWTDYFYIPGGNGAGSAITCYIYGPCYANSLTVTAVNTDASAGCSIDNYVVSQTSHNYTDTIIKQAFFTGVNGFTNPDGIPATGVLCSASPSVAFGTSTLRLLPVWSGKAGIFIDNLGNSSATRVRLLDPTGVLYSAANNNKDFFGAIVGATSGLYQEIALPQGPVVLELHNNGTSGSQNLNCVITRMDY